MTRKITLLALVPVLALGLAACGSSRSDGASSSSTSPMSSMPMPSETTSSEPAESSSGSSDAASAVISITDFAFAVPTSVAPGATITIKNGDSEAHTVTSKTGGFDVKIDPKGTAILTAPTKPGSYPFICSFHADMAGTLVVK